MLWKLIDRLLLPAAFFLIAFVVALTLWQLLINHRRAEIQNVTADQALFVKTKMESELRAVIAPLENLAEGWLGQIDHNAGTLEFDSKLVMSAYPAYQAVEWVDATHHVRLVTPQNRNQGEVGTDLNAVPQSAEALRSAEQTGKT